MTDEGFKRTLSAILSADVEGYSRLMGEDEDATIRTLTTYRELMSTIIQKHRGRVVDSPGDNLLAEFGSVVDAVRCAVEIQEEFRVRNAELSENRKMEFRIGINLGDVVKEGERIYGDGVNITARVEGLSEGGGICISGTVYDSIKNKLSLSYESLGEHTVKNITEPIRVYRMRVGPDAAAPGVSKEKRLGVKRWQWTALAAVVVLIVGAVAIWNFYFRLPSVEPASVEKMAFTLPDKPSIAVLPFDNMSGDQKQDYFSDGLTEEIITALSKIGNMYVIARNSMFTYKGKPVKAKQVAEELGVHYVLEGSVRKDGDRVRITAQLVDAINGHHLWAERYDRNLKDIFVIQDDITKNIITALQMKLSGDQYLHIMAKGTDNLEAYLKLLQIGVLWRGDLRKNNVLVRQLAEEAIALDPNYASAYNELGNTHLTDIYYGLTKDMAKSKKTALELGQKAQALDEKAAHDLFGSLYQLKGQHEKAVAEAERYVELFPNNAWALLTMGRYLRNADRVEESIPFCKKGLRLDPYAKAPFFYNLGVAYWMMGQYEEAISICKKGLKRNPDDMITHMVLAVSYIEKGDVEEARASTAEVLRINPKISLDYLAKMLPWKNKDQVARWIDDLGKAGLK